MTRYYTDSNGSEVSDYDLRDDFDTDCNEDDWCRMCNGTGEGMRDESTCISCNGKGYIRNY